MKGPRSRTLSRHEALRSRADPFGNGFSILNTPSSWYNTPYGLEEVARCVAQLKDKNIEAVLTTTRKNTADLYGLK